MVLDRNPTNYFMFDEWDQDQEKQALRITIEELTMVYLAGSSEIDQHITKLITEEKEANQEKIGQFGMA